VNPIGLESAKQFVIRWNNRFPIDLWFRKKYSIPFNSSVHQESDFIDQLFEFLEHRMLQEEVEKKEKYQPGKANWLKQKKYSEQEIQEIFDNLNLDDIK
jgi:hypothetical protein